MRWLYPVMAVALFVSLAQELTSAGFVRADWETRTTIILIVGGSLAIVVDSVNTIRKGK
jgi:hypothetical protein